MMKVFSKLSILFAVLIVLNACGSGSNNPESVSHRFLSALEEQDFAVARSLITPESEAVFSLVESFTSAMDERQARSYQHRILETKVIGDTAHVSYEMWTLGLDDNRDQLELKLLKMRGKWKVSLERDNITK